VLDTAIKAQLPLVSTYTVDFINTLDVVNSLSASDVIQIDESNWKKKMTASVVLSNTRQIYMFINPTLNFNSVLALYNLATNTNSTVILVNPIFSDTNAQHLVLDTGELPIPAVLVDKLLKPFTNQQTKPSIITALGGLTLQRVAEVLMLTTVNNNALTPENILKVRRSLNIPVQGIEQVNVTLTNYYPNEEIESWLIKSAPFLLTHNKYSDLKPRGLILGGPPGVGKTMAAKRIAKSLKIPLYALDITSILGRYMGDSEGRFSQVLTNIEQQSPCVFLIDEIEKLFKGTTDNSVSGNILSKLLWWLQEHQSNVVTIMTTNNVDLIPPELHRPGRIDALIILRNLPPEEQYKLFISVLSDYITPLLNTKSIAKATLNKIPSDLRSNAAVVEAAKSFLREYLITNEII
jgi:ATP-dependent Zn protease